MPHSPQPTVPYEALFLLLMGYPVGRSVQILAKRFLFEPYPREARGPWLFVGWAIGLLITVVQFALVTMAQADQLETHPLSFGIPSLLYSATLLFMVNTMFPMFPTATEGIPFNFLLVQFESTYRRVYSGAFALAVIPFIIGMELFRTPLTSPSQLVRIALMVCFLAGFFVSPKRLAAHISIWVIAFPLVLFFYIFISKF